MKPLVVIPARGGSKGLPGKNIKLLGGKPLIQYTIEAAREVFPDNIICVSTDDMEIKCVAEKLGLKVPFIRPDELATDQAGTYEVLLHAISFYENIGYTPDTLVLLQATSPFRTGIHIREGLALFEEKIEMVVSVREAKANPYYTLYEESAYGFLQKSKYGSFARRQDCPKVWEINGALYIMNAQAMKSRHINDFSKIVKYVMNEWDSIDIDSHFDFFLAENLLKYSK
jgi:CMP-N,N'-diacetyllegionaminic acid synthase